MSELEELRRLWCKLSKDVEWLRSRMAALTEAERLSPTAKPKKPSVLDAYRGTGRTERMLQAVRCELRKGNHCVVLCAHQGHMRLLMEKLSALLVGAGLVVEWSSQLVRVPKGGQAVFTLTTPSDLEDPGRRRKELVFADHYTIEYHMPWALKQWVQVLPHEEGAE